MLRYRDGTVFPGEITSVVGLGGRAIRRRPGHGPRHHPAGTPRTRAARVAGALPVPRRELTGRRLLDRRRGQLHVHVRLDGAGLRLEAGGGHRQATSRASWTSRAIALAAIALAGAGRRPGHRAGLDPQAAWAGREADPGRGQRHRDGRRRRTVRRHPRRHPRHQRARPPRARAARIRGALPLPRGVLAGPRLADRCRRDADLHQRRGALDARHRADRAHGPAVRRDLRPERPPRRDDPLPLAGPPSDRRPPDAPAVPARRRARRPGRDQRHGHDRRRRLHRGARGRPRRQRARPARTRPAPPGGRAGRRRGARPPGPRAARFGDPGAVLDDARVALGGDAPRSRPGRRPAPSSSSCATCSARRSPRCALSSSSSGPATSSRTG